MELTKTRANKKTPPRENYDLLEPVDLPGFFRLFNPQVPVIVCTKHEDDVAAMPANSCSPASDSPPMVSLALRRGIRTNRVLRQSSKFSINWVNFEPEESRRVVLELAKPSEADPEHDKLKEYKIPYFLERGIPVLKQATAYGLCTVKRRIATGDHDLFIGSVVKARALRDFTEDGYWRFKDYKPVLYVGSIRPNPLITI